LEIIVLENGLSFYQIAENEVQQKWLSILPNSAKRKWNIIFLRKTFRWTIISQENDFTPNQTHSKSQKCKVRSKALAPYQAHLLEHTKNFTHNHLYLSPSQR